MRLHADRQEPRSAQAFGLLLLMAVLLSAIAFVGCNKKLESAEYEEFVEPDDTPLYETVYADDSIRVEKNPFNEENSDQFGMVRIAKGDTALFTFDAPGHPLTLIRGQQAVEREALGPPHSVMRAWPSSNAPTWSGSEDIPKEIVDDALAMVSIAQSAIRSKAAWGPQVKEAVLQNVELLAEKRFTSEVEYERALHVGLQYAYRGHEKIPMLSVYLYADDSPSSSFEIALAGTAAVARIRDYHDITEETTYLLCSDGGVYEGYCDNEDGMKEAARSAIMDVARRAFERSFAALEASGMWLDEKTIDGFRDAAKRLDGVEAQYWSDAFISLWFIDSMEFMLSRREPVAVEAAESSSSHTEPDAFSCGAVDVKYYVEPKGTWQCRFELDGLELTYYRKVSGVISGYVCSTKADDVPQSGTTSVTATNAPVDEGRLSPEALSSLKRVQRLAAVVLEHSEVARQHLPEACIDALSSLRAGEVLLQFGTEEGRNGSGREKIVTKGGVPYYVMDWSETSESLGQYAPLSFAIAVSQEAIVVRSSRHSVGAIVLRFRDGHISVEGYGEEGTSQAAELMNCTIGTIEELFEHGAFNPPDWARASYETFVGEFTPLKSDDIFKRSEGAVRRAINHELGIDLYP
jgi:hypothetical protein